MAAAKKKGAPSKAQQKIYRLRNESRIQARRDKAKRGWETRRRNAAAASRHTVKNARHSAHVKEGAGTLIKRIEDAAMPLREQVLREGLALTMGDRNRSYGDPLVNLDLTARLKLCFWMAMNESEKPIGQNTPFGHSIDMVLTNLARIATSPTTHLERDRFLDGANYMAIAYEVGVRSEQSAS